MAKHRGQISSLVLNANTPKLIVTNGLVGYWHFQKGVSGSSWNNIAPATVGQYNGTINGPVLQADGMYFDGVDDFVAIAHNLNLDVYSIEVCINNQHTATSGFKYVVSGSTSDGYLIDHSTNKFTHYYPSNAYSATTAIAKNTDAYVTFTKDALNNGYWYINNAKQSQIQPGKIGDTSASTLYFGKHYSTTGLEFKGLIKYVRIYSRQLTDAEVAQNYAAGTDVGLVYSYATSLSDTITVSDSTSQMTGKNYPKSLSDSVMLTESTAKTYNSAPSLKGRAGMTALVTTYADDSNVSTGITRPFFGTNQTVWVGSNSYITFGNGSSQYSGISHSSTAGLYMVAADRNWQWVGVLDTTDYTRIRWEGQSGSGNGNPPYVWEATIFSDGVIQVITGPDLPTGAVGLSFIANGSDTNALDYNYAVTDCIRFTPKTPASTGYTVAYGQPEYTISHPYTTSLSDSVSTSDSVTKQFNQTKLLADTVSLSDAITPTFTAGTTSSVVTNGLIGYWNFQQGLSGSNWNNIAPGKDGLYGATLTGGSVSQANGVYFDGIDDLVTVNTPPNLVNSSYTFEVIFKMSAVTSSPSFMDWEGSSLFYMDYQNSSKQLRLYAGGGIRTFTLASNLLANQEYIYTATYDYPSKTLKMYLNGALQNTFTTINPITSANTQMYFGAYKSGSTTYADFKGWISSFKIYNAALSATDVTQNYNNGSAVGLGGNGTANTKSLSDTVTSSDSISNQSARKLSLNDSVSTTDSITTQALWSNSLSDSISTTDSISQKMTRTILLNDSVSTTDYATFGSKYLQMDGADDKFQTPSITYDKIELDIKISSPSDSLTRYILDAQNRTSGGFLRWLSNSLSNGGFNSVTGFVANTRTTIIGTLSTAYTGQVSFGSRFDTVTNTATPNNFYSVKFYNGATLVAHYDMTTGTVKDQSGNGNHATLTGGSWIDTNPTASYLQMDGVDDYLQLPTMTIKKIVIDGVFNTQADFKMLIDARSGMNLGYVYARSDGSITSAGANFNVTGYVRDTRTTVTFLAQNNMDVNGNFTDNVNIFSNNTGTENLRGLIYNIYCYNAANALVAYYDMTKGNVQDQSGNGNHATLSGGTFIDPSTPATYAKSLSDTVSSSEIVGKLITSQKSLADSVTSTDSMNSGLNMIVSDSFNRTASTTSLGSTNSAYGGSSKVWTITPSSGNAVYGINSSGRAYVATTSTNRTNALVDTGYADGIIECKFYGLDAASQRPKISIRAIDSNNVVHLGVDFGSGKNWLQLYYYDVGVNTLVWDTIAAGKSIVDGDIVKVMFIGSTYTIYINNVQVGTATLAYNSTITTHGFNMYNYSTSQIDDWKFYTSSLGAGYTKSLSDTVSSSDSATPSFTAGPTSSIVTNGLIGYWHCQQGVSGSTWNNIAPSTTGLYNGTITGGATIQSGGMYFDGVDDVTTITNFDAINTLTDFSFQVLMSFISTGNNITPYSWFVDANNRYGFIIDPSLKPNYGYNTGGTFNSMIGTSALTPGQQYLLTVVHNASGRSFYVDNTLIKQDTVTMVGKTYKLGIGAYFADTGPAINYFKGYVIHAKVYNKALTPAEISQNYAAGTAVGLSSGGTANTKSLSDTISVTDSISRQYLMTRSLSDSLVISDSIPNKQPGFAKSLADTIAVSDAITNKVLASNKSLSDSVNTTETSTKQYNGSAPPKYHLSLDGVDDFLSTNVTLPTDFEIEMDFVTYNDPNIQKEYTLFGQYLGGNTGRFLAMIGTTSSPTGNGKVCVFISGQTLICNTKLTVGQRYKLKFVMTNKQLSVYLDGVLDGQFTYSNFILQTTTMSIGVYNKADLRGFSKMDLYGFTVKNILAYDMTTGTVQDQSGNGNHATLNNGGTWVVDGTGFAASLTDTINTADSTTKQISSFKSLSDSVSTTDSAITTTVTFNKSLNDSTLISDSSITKQVGFKKSIADFVTTTDSANRAGTSTKSLSDSTSISDSPSSRIISDKKSVNDSVTTTDSITRSAAFQKLIVDSVSLSEMFTDHEDIIRPFSDTLTLSDSISASFNQASTSYNKSLNDAVALSDSQTKQMSGVKSLGDTVSISDSQTKRQVAKALTDSISASENANKQVSDQKSLADTVSINESLTKQFIGVKVISDSISSTDSVSKQSTKSLADSVASSDSSSRNPAYTKSLADTVSTTDIASKSVARTKSISDTVTTTDSPVSKKPVYTKTVLDTVSLLDSTTKRIVGSVVLTDTVTPTESFGASSTIGSLFTRTVLDAVSVADSFDKRFAGVKILTDTTITSDSPANKIRSSQKSLTDSVAASDTTAKRMAALKSFADSVDATEMFTNKKSSFYKLVADAVSPSDSTSKQVATFKSITDTVTTSESVSKNSVYNGIDHVVDLADNVLLSDAASEKYTGLITKTDTVSLTEASSKVIERNKSLSDSVATFDATSRSLSTTRTLSDSVSTQDTVTSRSLVQQHHNITLTDQLVVDDVMVAKFRSRPEDPIKQLAKVKPKGGRLRSDGNLTYHDFVLLLDTLLSAAWGKEWGTFLHVRPRGNLPTNQSLPLITYYLENMVPGKIGKDTKEIRPRYRTSEVDSVNGTVQRTNIYGQAFDASIVFEVWAPTNLEAEELQHEFRRFLQTYAGYFKEKGLRNFQFVNLGIPQFPDRSINDQYETRILRYMVSFEELHSVPTDYLKVISVVEERMKSDTTND